MFEYILIQFAQVIDLKTREEVQFRKQKHIVQNNGPNQQHSANPKLANLSKKTGDIHFLNTLIFLSV